MVSFLVLLIQIALGMSVESFILKNADNMVRDTESKTIQLEGNVQVIYQQQYLSCDEAVIHLETKTIEALGNVVFTTPNMYAEAEKMFFNYENDTGIIYNGYVQSGQVSFEGELIYKVGDQQFETSKAAYSACTTCPPAWSFTGSEIKATFGSYARIKNPVLRIADIPIFWFPYLIVPIKNERQTGILTPSHEISRQGGNAFSLPVFWALSDSRDLTYTPKLYEKKGLKSLFEYRYVLSPNSKGNLNYAYIKDEVFPESDRVQSVYGNSLEERGRWFLSYEHKYELPSFYEHRVDINLASDLQYAYDYEEEFPFYREPAVPNRLSLSRYHPNQFIGMDVLHHTNLLKTDPLADNNEAVHKMPNIKWSLKNTRYKDYNLYYKFDMDYSHFARNSLSFDDLNDNGVYDEETDVIRSGQRLIFKPTITAPFHIGDYVDVLPALSYQYSGYKFADIENESPRQDLVEAKISFRTLLSKVYKKNKELAYKHKIIPFVTYTKLPYIERNDHPFWGELDQQPYSTDQSINDNSKIQFDFFDRLERRDFFLLGVQNFITRKRYSNNIPYYDDIFMWSISQKYDLNEAERDDSASEAWSNITNDIWYRKDRWNFRSKIDYYPYQNHINSSSRIRYIPRANNFWEISYNQNFVINRGEEADSSSESQDVLFSTAYNFGDVNIAGSFEYSAVTHSFEDYQYGIQIMPPGECWNFSISQIVNSQDIKTKFNFNFLFDGKRNGEFNPNEIF